MYLYSFISAGRGNGRGATPFLTCCALDHEIVTLVWVDNASVRFPLSINVTEGLIFKEQTRMSRHRPARSAPMLSLAPVRVFGRETIIEPNLCIELKSASLRPDFDLAALNL